MTAPPPRPAPSPFGPPTVVAVLALLAAAAPLISADPSFLVAMLLVATAAVEAWHGLRRSTDEARRAAWAGAGLTLAMAVLLLNAPLLAQAALLAFVAGTFALDAVRYAAAAIRHRRAGRSLRDDGLPALGNLAVAVLVLLLRGRTATWTLALAAALRIAGTAYNLLTAPVYSEEEAEDTVLEDLGLTGHPEMVAYGAQIEAAERERSWIDREWIVGYVLTLLAIHLGRMGTDRSALGVLSPVVAVLGDLVFAFIFAFLLIVPLRLGVRRLTRGVERAAWARVLAPGPNRGPRVWARHGVRWWLDSRFRFATRLRAARYSLPVAVSRGLQMGLPLAAIMAATVPVWGMSWYFDTENWAAGVWNSWAEARVDVWRSAMARSVVDAGRTRLDASGFAVAPPGVTGQGDFGFIVIGDTGEGDASQHVLRDQLLRAAAQDGIRFVVVSSDVVYPTGAMKDYEPRFWLPFKGVQLPVYAIPGNHDWYDALESFVATFFEPASARLALQARIDADAGVTSTDDTRVRWYVDTAARLRGEYGVRTGFQHGPFFHVQTDRFALIAVDTGVLKRVDDEQMTWLKAVLEAARGKTVMAILGHPLYAGGYDQTGGNEDFAAIRALLDSHGARIVMAGDTHDLEYYGVPAQGGGTAHHFVNGGGGAYLSFGTALAWPAAPAAPAWAFYPSRPSVRAKIQAATPWWKLPAWWWTDRFGAWPFSAEWLSAAFDYNVAPFFQSFVEVRVEGATGRVRLRPWGVHGRLTWSDLQRSPGLGIAGDEPVEWVVEPHVP